MVSPTFFAFSRRGRIAAARLTQLGSVHSADGLAQTRRIRRSLFVTGAPIDIHPLYERWKLRIGVRLLPRMPAGHNQGRRNPQDSASGEALPERSANGQRTGEGCQSAMGR